MSEQSTTHPQTGMDRFLGALRSIGIRRRTHDKWIAGVCSGLADRLGIDPVIVRVALVLLTMLGGAGIAIYLVAWALLPNDRDEIPAQRALRDGDGGSIVLLVFAALALFGDSAFGGTWWSGRPGWGFPWGLVLVGLLIWWLVQRSDNRPDADQRVMNQQLGAPTTGAPTTGTLTTGTPTTGTPTTGAPTTSVPSPAASGPAMATGRPTPSTVPPSPTWPVPVSYNPVSYKRLGRRSGGPLMALIAIGLALATYGSLLWAGAELNWTGSHQAIAFAGSLAAMGLLMVVLGFAGWRPGFVTFLAIVLSIAAWSSAVVPTGIHLGGRIGDATWAPTSVSTDANYQLGVGNGVLNLSGLPTEGLSEAKIPAYVGMGELKVLVPQDLTVKVVGHVGLGEILLPNDAGSSGQGGSDVSRTVTIGDGPTEVVVDAGVGIGQLTVVKE
jgi:phage shock protein PspC (stress-responsive transcriptional regulator)